MIVLPGLAGAGIVRKRKPDLREAQERIVDCLKLMQQGVYPGDRQREVRIVLVGDPQLQRLYAGLEFCCVAVKWLLFG
jgi:hypothetical protein